MVFSIVVVKVLVFLVGYNFAPVLWLNLNTPGSPYRLAYVAVLAVSWMPISLGVGIAILRYRLFDIDIIIRRTLLYGTLTALLAAVYTSSVVAFHAFTQAVTGQRDVPPLVVVASTLLIAALFNPLRQRLQATIDRRFYRRSYDTERTLATFAATLREQVELPELTDHLLAAVEETMHPAHLSLWFHTKVPHERYPG